MIMFITRCVSHCSWINTNWRSTLQRCRVNWKTMAVEAPQCSCCHMDMPLCHDSVYPYKSIIVCMGSWEYAWMHEFLKLLCCLLVPCDEVTMCYAGLCLQVMWPQQEREGDPTRVDNLYGGSLRGLVLLFHVYVVVMLLPHSHFYCTQKPRLNLYSMQLKKSRHSSSFSSEDVDKSFTSSPI